MDILLDDSEVRVLGCLMEKEMATPDYYPLSLNTLTNACNQKSNRTPVVSYAEETVVAALDGLKEKKMVRQSNLSRVPKYEQIFSRELNLVIREEAVICILLVRGPQTIGEIRGRTERLYAYEDLNEVQTTVSSLEEMGLITKLSRQPGRKESRYMHLFGGEPEEHVAQPTLSPQETEITEIGHDKDRIGQLQEQVDNLQLEVQELRGELEAFKLQFE